MKIVDLYDVFFLIFQSISSNISCPSSNKSLHMPTMMTMGWCIAVFAPIVNTMMTTRSIKSCTEDVFYSLYFIVPKCPPKLEFWSAIEVGSLVKTNIFMLDCVFGQFWMFKGQNCEKMKKNTDNLFTFFKIML